MRTLCTIAACAAFAFAADGVQADTLSVCSEASPDALNSALTDSNTSFDVSEQIADRLVEMEIGGSKVIPGLAESWTISPDGLHYTFKLRHGVKFQSNSKFKPTREMNADDVVFSFTRMYDKSNSYNKVSGGHYPMYDDFVGPALKSVSRVSDDTVVFDLKVPSASLLSGARSASYRAELNYALGVLAPDPGTASTRFQASVQLDTHSRAVWHPHITVIRFRQAPRLRPAVPDLGTFSPSEAAVYHSVLRGSGAQPPPD